MEGAELESAQRSVPVVGAPRELSVRALLLGCGIGVVLAAGNVYTGLKTSFIDGGSITAALLGFAFFATFKRLARRPFSALENNITQTTASSAAIMSFALGLSGPIPALSLMGHNYSGWALAAWAICLGTIGILIANTLRRKLILVERLPFPTGAATAEVIETIVAARHTALRRAGFLVMTALLSMAFAWFRDGRPSLIPQSTMFGGALLGVSLARLTVGLSWSPLLVSTGMLMGFRSSLSMLLGGIASWLCLAPWLVRTGTVATASFGSCAAWLIWPALGLLVAGSFLPLLLDWRALVRSLRDLPALLRRRAGAAEDHLPEDGDRFRWAKPLFLISVAGMLVIGQVTFHISPVITIIGVGLAVVLADVCARTAGETDMAPIGAVGTLTQLTFAGNGPVTSLVAASIVSGTASETSQTMWALKAGHQLKASPNAQLWAQLLGAVLGGLVVVPVYFVLIRAYGIGTETMPAPGALSWKATAEAVRGGFGAMPKHAPLAGGIGFLAGVLLAALGRTRLGRFVPSPAAMGMAMITPFFISATAFLGGLVLLGFKRFGPAASEATLMSVAAGGIAGESVMGVIIATLIATGLL
jgi:putative OPT family oligopeptide transporter